MCKQLMMASILGFISLFNSVSATPLLPAAEKLQAAYQKLQLSHNNRHYQQQYLTAFPTTKRDFIRLFSSSQKDQLFDGNDYIFQLERLAVNHPQQTLQLVLKLASELNWQNGAANYLQFVLMKIALNDPLAFSQQMHSLAQRKRQGVIRFMAQGSNGPAVGYGQLVKVLRRLNKNQLVDQLEDALFQK